MSLDLVIIGLGYVGLPLALEATRAGMSVAGLDLSQRVVDGLNHGVSHVDDLSDGDIAEMVAAGFRATNDDSVLADADAIVICVPTPLSPDGGPDLTAVRGATASVAKHIRKGQLVVLESTTYPGTTEDELKPTLEAGGLKCGQDFHLAFSPERIDPGNAKYGVKNTPKVVGGCDQESTEVAQALYSRFIDEVVPVRSSREAEMAKLLENTYRHINIALVNEMAKFCHDMDIDLWEVIKAASTKPFGFQAFYPGPGVGGHCIPIDPNYLSHTVRARLGYPFRFVELAQEINLSMPNYVANRAQQMLNKDSKALRGSKILLLGVTYKPDIADQRESPAVPVAKALAAGGALVSYCDPRVAEWHVGEREWCKIEDPVAKAGQFDLVILLQKHREFDIPAIVAASQRFLDTRGVVAPASGVDRL